MDESTTMTDREPGASEVQIKCLLCNQMLPCAHELMAFKTHLLQEHHFVIGDIEKVALFPRYVEYWSKKLTPTNLRDYCYEIRTNSHPSDSGKENVFWMLCDDRNIEDKEIRYRLHMERLKAAVRQFEFERQDMHFSEMCLFCLKELTGNRRDFFQHMHDIHHSRFGNPDNLVYVKRLIALLRSKMDQCVCFHCNGQFPDRHTLKEHMRKKFHRCLPPEERVYDEFYMVNYLEYGKTWTMLEEEFDPETEKEFQKESNIEFEENVEEVDESELVECWNDLRCLLCSFQTEELPLLLQHTKCCHNFDFEDIRETYQLGFYELLQLCTFVRSQQKQGLCFRCETRFTSAEECAEHVSHCQSGQCPPPRERWESQEFLLHVNHSDVNICNLLRLSK